MTGINGVAPEWDERELYWVYSSGEVADDLSVDYTYYEVGASYARPEAGTVEAWVVGTGKETPALTTLAETPAATQILIETLPDGPSSDWERLQCPGRAPRPTRGQ